MEQFQPASLSEYLKQYYNKLFPFKSYCQWLEYGDLTYFQRREFAFVLENDSYLRFKSYINRVELEKDVQLLLPCRIELGAIYNHRPKDGRSKPDFSAVERELIFDIDLNDYDDVRKCCSRDSLCKKCWQFMTIAVKIIDTALDEDFGFDHRLWVFSGRRGIHCWVCDKSARQLSQDARTAIVDYLTIVLGGEQKAKKVALPADAELHPSLARAVGIILDHFAHLAEGQGWFDNADTYNPFLDLLADDALSSALRKDFEKRETTFERAQAVVSRLRKKGNMGVNKPLTELVLQLAYPRLDAGVSKTINHLLKTPFSVHPKTGNICVPLRGSDIDKFDLGGVPRVDVLYAELLSTGRQGGAVAAVEAETANRKALEYKRTSMAAHVRVFEEFVQELCDSTSERKQETTAIDDAVEL